MYFSLSFILLFTTALFALDTTKKVQVPIIACQNDSQCPSPTHVCNIEQKICILKGSLNSPCEHDNECLTGKCGDRLCRRPCKKDKECSPTKEYCSISNYCNFKHCGSCIRPIQCANNRCHLFQCATNNCTTMLRILRRQP